MWRRVAVVRTDVSGERNSFHHQSGKSQQARNKLISDKQFILFLDLWCYVTDDVSDTFLRNVGSYKIHVA
jgi:hypothetical protein